MKPYIVLYQSKEQTIGNTSLRYNTGFCLYCDSISTFIMSVDLHHMKI